MHFNDAPLARPVCYQRKTKTKVLHDPHCLFVCFLPDLLQICSRLPDCDVSVHARTTLLLTFPSDDSFICFFFPKRICASLRLHRRYPQTEDLRDLQVCRFQLKLKRSPWFCSHYPEAALILAFGACRVALSRSSVPTASASHRFHQQAGNSF